MRRFKLYVHPRWIMVVAAVPWVFLGLVALGVQVYGRFRYDDDYFTAELTERYSKPGTVARALETALRRGDHELLAELQAQRGSVEFDTSPDITFVMLLERTDRYLTYLYVDMRTYERYPHYVESVRGRWVVSPPDLYYYMNSGQWQSVFLPLSLVWWGLGIATIVFVWVLRASTRLRNRLYGS